MIRKSEQILQIISLLDNTFENTNFVVKDWWDTANSIGFQLGNKLIYVAFYGQDDYFYECNILDNESEQSYKVQNSDNVTKEQLLTIIAKFFDI